MFKNVNNICIETFFMEMRHSGLCEQFGLFFFLLNTTDKDVWFIIQGFNYSSKTAVILLKKKISLGIKSDVFYGKVEGFFFVRLFVFTVYLPW